MASDLETITAMLDKVDALYRVSETVEQEFKNTHPRTTHVLDTPITYTNGSARGRGNLGYLRHFTGFGFDEDGTLLWIGAWRL